MSELKPCPFCGGRADIFKSYGHSGIQTGVRVACFDRACNMGNLYKDLTSEEAIKAWNTRVDKQA